MKILVGEESTLWQASGYPEANSMMHGNSPPSSMDNRVKPLFMWQALQGEGFLPNARKQANLSAAIQKFFFRLRDERLDSQSARQRYTDEIEAIRDSMTEVGVIVTEPRWFADLFR